VNHAAASSSINAGMRLSAIVSCCDAYFEDAVEIGIDLKGEVGAKRFALTRREMQRVLAAVLVELALRST
jgi:hypothetical protein